MADPRSGAIFAKHSYNYSEVAIRYKEKVIHHTNRTKKALEHIAQRCGAVGADLF